jgi:hypothetical protein
MIQERVVREGGGLQLKGLVVARWLKTFYTKKLIGSAAPSSAPAAPESSAAATGHFAAAAVGSAPACTPAAVSPGSGGHVVTPAPVAPACVVAARPASRAAPHAASHASSHAVRLEGDLLDLDLLVTTL